MWKERVCFIFFLYVSFLQLKGQSYSELEYQTLDIKDGLSHSSINALHKDKTGFVWIGTTTGLCRFDGIEIKQYKELDSHLVNTINEDINGNLYVGTDKGLYEIRPLINEVEKKEFEDADISFINTIVATVDNHLLIGTDKGLFYIRSNSAERILIDNNILSLYNKVNLIIRDNQPDCYWIATSKGLVLFHLQTREVTLFDEQTNPIYGKNILALNKIGNNVFIGTENQGLFKLDINSRNCIPFAKFNSKYIKDIKNIGQDTLCIATNGNGIEFVSVLNEKVIDEVKTNNSSYSIPSNTINCLLIEDGQLFLGTPANGLSYSISNKKMFGIYSLLPQFNTKGMRVRSFWIGKHFKLIGTRNGFYYVNEKEKEIRKYTKQNSGLESDIILFIHPFGDDSLIGTFGGGLSKFTNKNKQISFLKEHPFFKTNTFSGCVIDEKGNYWISTSKGVCVYNTSTDTYQVFTVSNSALSNDDVISIMQDSKNRIWLGTNDLITVYDPERNLFDSNFLPAEIREQLIRTVCIYEDHDKNIWFSNKNGIIIANEFFTDFKQYRTGFFENNTVTGIIEHNGEFWLSSTKGLCLKTKDEIKVFTLYDGLPGYVFNSKSNIYEDNTLWWGNEEGLVYYSGSNERMPIGKSPVITDLWVDNVQLAIDDEKFEYTNDSLVRIKLPQDSRQIKFSFSSLVYAAPKTQSYEYCVEDIEKNKANKEWKGMSGYNSFILSDLSPGKYLIKVRNNSFPEQILKINLIIYKPQYRILLNVLIVLFMGGLIYSLYSYSLLRKKYKLVKLNQVFSKKDDKYQKSRLEESKVLTLKNALLLLIENEKIYLNPEIKLSDIAKRLNCSAVDLSQLLNLHLNTNFSDFINEYRINEFLKRIQNNDLSKYTLVTLSEKCGFSSQSSFFRAFKRIKGKSPMQYIKDENLNTIDK